MLIALIEESTEKFSVNNQENKRIAEIAQMYGCRTHFFPSTLAPDMSWADTFVYVPEYSQPTAAVWVGFIPSFEKYKAIYEIAASKNIFLLNTPEEHLLIQEFHRYYPLITDLTPKSVVVEDIEDCSRVVSHLNFPLFIRGAVKSNKDQGWKACVAHDEIELEKLIQEMFLHKSRTRGRVIVRELAQLRHHTKMLGDFPRGREYRVFVYQNETLAFGYYWDEFEDEFPLMENDIAAIKHITSQAAISVGAPFMVADVGQLENGDWIIIEVGDAQFAGLSNVPILELWSKLSSIRPSYSN